MGAQSPFDQLKEARISQSALISLGAGLILGLILGLLIGWVWWPVEWQGNVSTVAPAASPAGDAAAPAAVAPSGGLSPAAKASYLSAVADGYVPYSNAEAAQVASQRVAELGSDTRANFDEAITYLATQPDANLRISNLVALASAVGIPLDIANNPALAGIAELPTAVATAEATEVATTPDDGGMSFPSWLAVLLLAGILVAGGLYLLRYVAQRRVPAPEVAEVSAGFVDEDFAAAAPSTSTFDRSSLAPMSYESGPASSSVRTAPGVQSSPVSGATTAFDEEDEEFEGTAAYTTRPVAYRTQPATPVPPVVDVDDDDDFDDDEFMDQPGTSVESAPPPATSRLTTAVPAPRPPVAGRTERYTTLDSHTATYQVGMLDFDYTKNVENTKGTGYIGEYGIGISERHGTINNNLEQVVALEVYLFDKTDETQMSTVTRVLLSEYAHDNLYKVFDREKQSADPITAQPNTNFQLEGKQLLLDCTVTDVRYTRDGIFQAVTVEMVLKQKG